MRSWRLYERPAARSCKQRSSLSDTDDRVTRYAYDGAGRLAKLTDAEDHETFYGYDQAGRTVLEYRDRLRSDGSTTVREGAVTRHDLAGRVVFRSHARWTGTAWAFTDGVDGAITGDTDLAYEAVHLRYNAYGELTGRGRTAATASPVYQEAFDYDPAGRLWRTNADSGVLRFHLHDRAGNQTLTLTSAGADLSALTFAGFTASIGSTDTVTTFATFSKRGEALATVEPDRLLATGAAAVTIERERSYNAFGEVASETDARGNVTEFEYNAMGRLTEKKAPEVSVTAEDGGTATIRPTETYGYDIAGRLVAVTDANGHATTRLLLAGTGHQGTEALVREEYHPDTGVAQTKYDVFRDARTVIDEVGNSEARRPSIWPPPPATRGTIAASRRASLPAPPYTRTPPPPGTRSTA